MYKVKIDANTISGDNMKKTNSIRIFSVLSVAVVLAASRLFFPAPDTQKDTGRDTEKQAAKSNGATPKEDKTSQEQEVRESLKTDSSYAFVIVAEDGYLTVYQSDLKTVYEYTDIKYDELDDAMQDKVNNGYSMKNVEELYSFLENYSS